MIITDLDLKRDLKFLSQRNVSAFNPNTHFFFHQHSDIRHVDSADGRAGRR